MNSLFDWNKYDADFEVKRLKNLKSGSIAYIKDIDKWTKWEVFHAHWETYLTSHEYWKNWQEKINSFQTKKEVNFYTDRLQAFMEFVEKYTLKDINVHCGRVIEGERQWDPVDTPKLIEQELKRLENISEEEFNKTDKWRKSGSVFKELSVEEMKNDPWFSKQLGFGSENQEEKPVKKDDSSNNDYKSWTKDQLISEINYLKSEIESLKNNQTITSSEKEVKLNENQQRLEQLEKLKGDNHNIQNTEQNNFPTGLVIGGGALVIATLTTFLVIKSKKKKG